MRLSLKLAAAMAFMAAVVLLVADWVTMHREATRIETEIARDASQVAESFAKLATYTSAADPTEAFDLLTPGLAGRTIRWISADVALSPPIDQGTIIQSDGAGSEQVRSVVAVHRLDGNDGFVEVTESLHARDALVQRNLTRNALAVFLVTVFSGLVALVAGHQLVGARVEQLVAKAHAVGRGDYGAPLQMSGRDELTLLARALNEMSAQLAAAKESASGAAEARLRAEVQLRHADRLTTVGQLAAGVAHELGTPLNVISGRAALLQRHLSTVADRHAAQTIRDQARRIIEIVQRMLDFARQHDPAPERVDLGELTRESLELLRSTARGSQVEIALEIEDTDLHTALDRGQIQQVITNLVINGVQAMPDGGQLSVRVGRGACGTEDHLHIEISDQGQGIAPADIPRIFDPFFTTKEPGEGTGLGLSIVHGIVTEHGGRVTVRSQLQRGTTFTVHLPARPA